MIGYEELEASIAAVYDAQLSIPPWWPADERREFINEMAGQATGLVMTELDDIVDRIIDQVGPTTDSDAIAAAITTEQHVLLSDVRTTVLYDLTEAIADKSADLTADAVFAHSRLRGPLGRLSGVRLH